MIKENEVSMTPYDHYQHNVNKQGRLSHLCLFYCFNVALMYDFVYHAYPAYLPTCTFLTMMT